ncbi:protoporphyrinogen oxidase [Phycomyces nitens]|nr:protoporphyrinogen oxidase [Phycomyces nitens]
MTTRIAVLGGGISGLSAAFYLSRLAPATSKIVLIEANDRVGGWIRSQRVSPGTYLSTPDDPALDPQSVLLEVGPRSLRPVGPGGAVVLDMISQLNIQPQVMSVPKTDPSAKNRYIYYNDQINTLPASPLALLFKPPPVFKSVIGSIINELRVPGQDWSEIEDESLYSFVKRRFNEHVALNLVGSITHGIYAGDVKALSVKSTLRILFENERVHGSVVKGLLKGGVDTGTESDKRMAAECLGSEHKAWIEDMAKQSVIGFKNGTETLTEALRDWLAKQPNVELVTGQQVDSVELTPSTDECKVTTSSATYYADHVVSALPANVLDRVLKVPLANLKEAPGVDVGVVNLVYDPDTVNLAYDGFGFLTPHPDSAYKLPVPGTLGVVFDSNAMRGQDSGNPVKMTVMIGGHQWDTTFGGRSANQVSPDEVLEYAEKSVGTYLGINGKPTHRMSNILASCIPQYRVGHESRLMALDKQTAQVYKGRLSLVGASYLGVSVPDCIKNSRELAENLVKSGGFEHSRRVTGLERIRKP